MALARLGRPRGGQGLANPPASSGSPSTPLPEQTDAPEETLARPVWFLAPGGRPVRAEAPPPEAAWWCREGDSEWKPISSDGWKEHSAFFALTQNGPGDRNCWDDAGCESSPKPTNLDDVLAATPRSNDPNQARESRLRVVSLRRPTRRRKHRPAPGQGTLFFVVKNGMG